MRTVINFILPRLGKKLDDNAPWDRVVGELRRAKKESRKRSDLARREIERDVVVRSSIDRVSARTHDDLRSDRSKIIRDAFLLHASLQSARMPTRSVGAWILRRGSRRSKGRFRALPAFFRITFDFCIWFSLTFTLSRPARPSLCTPFARFDRVSPATTVSVPVCIIPYTLGNVFDSRISVTRADQSCTCPTHVFFASV